LLLDLLISMGLNLSKKIKIKIKSAGAIFEGIRIKETPKILKKKLNSGLPYLTHNITLLFE
jgi:hypothetical protein